MDNVSQLSNDQILIAEVESCDKFAKMTSSMSKRSGRYEYFAQLLTIVSALGIGCVSGAIDMFPQHIEYYFTFITIFSPIVALINIIQLKNSWGENSQKQSNASDIFIGLRNSASHQFSLEPNKRILMSSYMSNFTITKSVALSIGGISNITKMKYNIGGIVNKSDSDIINNSVRNLPININDENKFENLDSEEESPLNPKNVPYIVMLTLEGKLGNMHFD